MSTARTDESITVAIASMGRPSLHRTLHALRRQPAELIDAVVVLDNSDGAMDRDAVRDSCARVRLRFLDGGRNNGGGRNQLLAAASTDVVLFTDDDCIPAQDWVARMARAMDRSAQVAAAFGRVEPVPRPDSRIASVQIPGVGVVAWGEAGTDGASLWCPAISAPSWTDGVYAGIPTVPWACVGSSNSLALRRSLMLPDRPVFLPHLGPGSPAGAGEDTELGYALMAKGRAVAYVASALVHHDAWLPEDAADQKRRMYLRSNVEALGHHVLNGDRRAGELLADYLHHFCAVNGISDLGAALCWAYQEAHPPLPDRS